MTSSVVSNPNDLLDEFRASLNCEDPVANICGGLIGQDIVFDGPFGPKTLLYADYVASGRPLRQVEDFVANQVLPRYANPHTEASFCGAYSTHLRHSARAAIARSCGADSRHAVIFCGAGATAALNRLVTLFAASERIPRPAGRLQFLPNFFRAGNDARVRVIIGPYEHHSNILPWRESGAEVVEIGEATAGGPDMAELSRVLHESRAARRVICAFSAASNITGITTDVEAVTRIVKAAGALMVWDYAGGGPYLPISMTPAPGVEIDAIAISPHKFVGGPASSGVLIVRRDTVVTTRPMTSGGGTVKFVSSRVHDYVDKLEEREEAGTPNYVGDVRAALTFLIKDAIGVEYMARRNAELTNLAIGSWHNVDGLEILGSLTAPRLPIFSLLIKDPRGGHVHPQLVTRILSDRFGIQARGGCACAGPYAHHLLSIGPAESERLRCEILAGNEANKPGFTRLNFSVLMPESKVRFIIDSVATLPEVIGDLQGRYVFSSENGLFAPR
ncbi:MAG: aminotransferase class V-fold PLP-dependent enzyme [Alphaproteobacteria bacterium]|nr:aminotransferase class V-fold PLP-dependent enzyme [Alphaproteobacteria bacterium]